MKTIAVSKSLTQLKDGLQNIGYEVFFEDEINWPVDIFIYSQNNGQPSLYSTTQMLNSHTFSNSYPDPGYSGTLLIDGTDKSIEEIRYIIENRVYSPIF